jgi:hypothetical protein
MSEAAGDTFSPHDPDVVELLDHYERWRRAYARAGRPPRDMPDWANGKLYLREGFPYPDWSAFALGRNGDGEITFFHVSTERRNAPLESLDYTFSDVPTAGKYLLCKVGDYLRIDKRLDPVSRQFRERGLSNEVDKTVIDDEHAKYVLKRHPRSYFISGPRGISPINWLLTMSYDDLNEELAQGFASEVLRILNTATATPWRRSMADGASEYRDHEDLDEDQLRACAYRTLQALKNLGLAGT